MEFQTDFDFIREVGIYNLEGTVLINGETTYFYTVPE